MMIFGDSVMRNYLIAYNKLHNLVGLSKLIVNLKTKVNEYVLLNSLILKFNILNYCVIVC